MTDFLAIGLMSGSSLDGIDLAAVQFKINEKGEVHDWMITAYQTGSYDNEMLNRLRKASMCSGLDLMRLHVDLGHAYGMLLSNFINQNNLQPDLVASHGHTIFHKPEYKMTCQIGDGAAIASYLSCPVITDLRSSDLAQHGQGAPMASLADRILFSDYEYFLNLGGIANLSCTTSIQKVSYDVCACNQLLNYFANKDALSFDPEGQLAASGIIRNDLLHHFNSWEYLKLDIPKSLDNTHVLNFILAADKKFQYSTSDFLRTAVAHISQNIAAAFLQFKDHNKSIFTTGGGTFNSFLIKEINDALSDSFSIHQPEKVIINFKEALLIALAGLRRFHGLTTFSNDETGARQDSCGGAIYFGNGKI